MADPTAEAPAPAQAAGAAPPASPQSSEAAAAAAAPRGELGVRELLEAGVHFGHQTRRWNPRMKPFLFGERNGVHIVDLDQTLPRFREAIDFAREVVASGGKILFVATKRQAQAPVKFEAERAGQFYVNNRWLGGMLTNFKTVKKSIERFKELLETVADEEKLKEVSKKDQARMNRGIEKYRKSLDGIVQMTRLPDALFVIDVKREAIAVSEAQRLGIPIVAVVDSNCDPQDIDFVIPGNDDSSRAILLYCARIADACVEGAAIHDERVQTEVAEQERARGPEKAPAPGTGRVVVEIKQQPRRGRTPTSYGEGARAEAEAAAKPTVSSPRQPPRAAPERPAAETPGEAAPPPAPNPDAGASE